jgi:hypothetical protein
VIIGGDKMKKLLVTLVVLAVALLTSCDNGTAPSVSEEKFKLEGHYDVYEWNNSVKDSDGTSKEAILKDWLNGGFSKKKEYNAVYFDGENWWLLNSDKMTAGGTFSLYDDEHIVWNFFGGKQQGIEKFTVIENDMIFFHNIGDDPSGISKGQSYFTYNIFKKSGRKGHIEQKDGSTIFVND